VRARDNQRSRLYDAERNAVLVESETAKRLLHNGARVRTTGSVAIEACQAYVDYVTSAAWFQRRWGRRGLTVRHKAYGASTYGSGYVSLPPWGRTEWVILHEIAHSVTGGNLAPHGPEFAAAYVALVKHMMGAESAKALRASMRQYRVRVAAAPKPDTSRRIVTRTETRAKAARKAALPTAMAMLSDGAQRKCAAAVIRAQAKAGLFGPSGAKTRTQALATARTLERMDGR
jgi:putative metallohydrolase (TIGR04338 family)